MLALFSKLVVLFLGEKRVKGLRVTKIVKQIKFEGVLEELQSRTETVYKFSFAFYVLINRFNC